MNTQDLALRFSELSHIQGFSFDGQLMPGDTDVLQITVGDYEEIPVYLSVTDTQVLCIAYLWHENEVIQDKRFEMMESMLEMNIPMPLSSFSKIGEQYVVFGALLADSSFEDVTQEVITLVENAVEAIEAMSDFLK